MLKILLCYFIMLFSNSQYLCQESTLRLVFLAMSKFSVFGVKRIWRVLILALFLKNTVS